VTQEGGVNEQGELVEGGRWRFKRGHEERPGEVFEVVSADGGSVVLRDKEGGAKEILLGTLHQDYEPLSDAVGGAPERPV
jgi:hypothetical protein